MARDGAATARTGAFAGIGLVSGLGAVSAKSCCLVPLLLASSGVGGASLSRVMVAFEPYLLAGAWLAVASAWAVAVLRRPSAACSAGAVCAGRPAAWRRYGLLTASTVVVALATAWERIDPGLAQLLAQGAS